MIVIAGLAILVVAVIAATARAGTRPELPSAVPPATPSGATPAGSQSSTQSTPAAASAAAQVIEAAKSETDPERLRAAADAADAAGLAQAADALREKAAATDTEGITWSSPVPDVSMPAWQRYVRLMAAAKVGTVSASNHLGIFQFGYKRLADLGYVTNVRKTTKNGKQVDTGDWVPPHSQARFLSDANLQYEAFVKHTLDHRRTILSRHKAALGKTFAGKVATLSGLLAVAKQAGPKGLESWLASEKDRQKFPHTTALFIKATGLF